MEWEKRPSREEPVAEKRTFTDDRGRRWAGTVMSGQYSHGEENAEVVFVCEDQPAERHRVAKLGREAAKADDAFRRMKEDDIVELFRDSREI